MITIQKPTKEDIEGIQEVFYKTWLITYPSKDVGITAGDIEEKFKGRKTSEAIQKITKLIFEATENQLFLVAKEEDSVVGVCRIEKKEMYNELMAIYVLPGYQRKGIGIMFWKKVKEFFGDEKDIVVRVATYNIQAINFYQKLGFIDTGKRFVQENFKMPISGSYIPEIELIKKSSNKVSNFKHIHL
jgi:GNAT superfamily N-acetyltransferase